MKTIKQIADEIGVSKQAVQKRIAREPLYTCLQPYIGKKGNTKYIAVVGENLIKSAFNEDIDMDASIDSNIHYDNQTTTSIDVLYILKQQLEEKDNQIKELQSELSKEREHSREQANKIAQIADQAQRLQLAQISEKNQEILDTSVSKSEKKAEGKSQERILIKLSNPTVNSEESKTWWNKILKR